MEPNQLRCSSLAMIVFGFMIISFLMWIRRNALHHPSGGAYFDVPYNEIPAERCSMRLGASCPIDSYCCWMPELDNVKCCDYKSLTSGSHHRGDRVFGRTALWNTWYSWFLIILLLATCFTGCNYYRRQQQLRLWQAQLEAERANVVQSAGVGTTQYSSLHGDRQVRIPVFLREVTIGNQRVRLDGAAALSSETADNDASLLPSYNEIANKPDLYPPPPYQTSDFESQSASDVEPPAYECVGNCNDESLPQTFASSEPISDDNGGNASARVQAESSSAFPS